MKSILSCFLVLASVAAILPPAAHASGERSGVPRNDHAACVNAFKQSPAFAQGCALAWANLAKDSCAINAFCPRPDGSRQLNKTSMPLVDVPLLQNCSGTLRFRCD
ncbi:hypothetical protein [Stenotrophomonas sp. SORGH_AS_0321]|uniref:hypothetical protein n=1 Tax=Stenotrophomonas sp. SORGH_AS_0321 TaxID=3041787 RepID=UPI00285F0C94|nr:hypothetical protein [Stenotrophomonas sp. SORGH_AS_0321]MDR6093611.1 hypothetical protein [Stenotrophomonas sp. SORGH_AS_0321]